MKNVPCSLATLPSSFDSSLENGALISPNEQVLSMSSPIRIGDTIRISGSFFPFPYMPLRMTRTMFSIPHADAYGVAQM